MAQITFNDVSSGSVIVPPSGQHTIYFDANNNFNSMDSGGDIIIIAPLSGYQPSGNYVVSGSSTILDNLNLSGTLTSSDITNGNDGVLYMYSPGEVFISGESVQIMGSSVDVTALDSSLTLDGFSILISASGNNAMSITNNIKLFEDMIPVNSNTLNVGTFASPFASGNFTDLYQNGNQVISLVSGLGNVTVESNLNGVVIISGSAGSAILPSTINATVLSGTTISGNNIYVETELFSPIISGTIISGTNIYIPKNGSLLTYGEIICNVSNSTIANPYVWGAQTSSLVSGNMMITQFSDQNTFIRTGYATQIDLVAYWPLILRGNSEGNQPSGTLNFLLGADYNTIIDNSLDSVNLSLFPSNGQTNNYLNCYNISSGITASISVSGIFSGVSYIGDVSRINFVVNGAMTSGVSYGVVEIPYNAKVLEWDMFADVSGSASLDVRSGTYSSYSGTPFSSTTSICGGSVPTISSAFKNQNTSPTWSGISNGEVLNFVANSTSVNVANTTLSLKIQKQS